MPGIPNIKNNKSQSFHTQNNRSFGWFCSSNTNLENIQQYRPCSQFLPRAPREQAASGLVLIDETCKSRHVRRDRSPHCPTKCSANNPRGVWRRAGRAQIKLPQVLIHCHKKNPKEPNIKARFRQVLFLPVLALEASVASSASAAHGTA